MNIESRTKTIIFSALIIWVIGGGLIFYLLAQIPTNARDNRDPAKQAEMMALTLEWGDLAPYPVTAQDIIIQTEGGMFSRTFISEYSAPLEDVEHWMANSPSFENSEFIEFQNGQKQYSFSPDSEACCVKVTLQPISDGLVKVTVLVAWS